MPSVLYTLLRGSKILIFLLIFINIFSNILIYVQPFYIGNEPHPDCWTEEIQIR